MASCSSCSAPLPANTACCRYCGTRNDMDFTAVGRFAASREESSRQCPHCRIRLQTIRLTPDGAFVIERCNNCFGLFFDPQELQAFLEISVAQAYEVNFTEITNINRERAVVQGRRVRYVNCPECGKFMNRVNFGYRSGVVMDQCKQHGVWLDNGELIHLMEWKKAGGQLLDEQNRKARAKEDQRRARAAAAKREGTFSFNSRMDDASDDVAQAAFSFLSRFFG